MKGRSVTALQDEALTLLTEPRSSDRRQHKWFAAVHRRFVIALGKLGYDRETVAYLWLQVLDMKQLRSESEE